MLMLVMGIWLKIPPVNVIGPFGLVVTSRWAAHKHGRAVVMLDLGHVLTRIASTGPTGWPTARRPATVLRDGRALRGRRQLGMMVIAGML